MMIIFEVSEVRSGSSLKYKVNLKVDYIISTLNGVCLELTSDQSLASVPSDLGCVQISPLCTRAVIRSPSSPTYN